jgi:hypothetical protein
MRLGGEAQHCGNRNVGMADATAKPVVVCPGGAIGFERDENTGYLRPAPVDPDIGHFLVQPLLVKKAYGLFTQPRCKTRNLQRLVPRRLGGREHHAVRGHEAVEIIQNAMAFDQHLTVIQHQGRYAGEGVIGPDFLRIAKHRPWPVLERQLVQSQRNARMGNHTGQSES